MITTLNGSTSNGNGHVTPVGGRGALRRKLSESARVALANDLASGTVSFVPSFAQAARAVGTTPYLMRQARKAYNKALKAEAKRAAKVEATTAITAAVTKFAAAETLLDTPAVRASLPTGKSGAVFHVEDGTEVEAPPVRFETESQTKTAPSW